MKPTIALLVVVIFTAGCLGGASDTTIKALQTQVAELSARQAEPTTTPTAEAMPLATKATSSSLLDGARAVLPGDGDEAAFCLALSEALEDEGWTVHDAYEDGLDIESASGRLYMLQYHYVSSDVSRLMLFSLWAGVGESNLSYETLSAINVLNDSYNLAKISVDADGDVWIETVYPFGQSLDVAGFTSYLTWFEAAEDTLVLDLLADYLE